MPQNAGSPGLACWSGALRRATVCGVLLLTACADATSSGAPTPTPSASPTAAPLPTASPTPAAGPRRIDVVATGLGSYLETTFPVAILHSAATTDVATRVTVRLVVVSPSGRTVATADPVSVENVPPGATVVVAGRVAGALRGDRSTAAVEVAAWVEASSLPTRRLAVAAGTLSCRGCSAGGSGDVTVMVSGDTDGTTLRIGVACRDTAGTIVGGGSVLHPGGPPPVTVSVPVILSAAAAGCADVSATQGGF